MIPTPLKFDCNNISCSNGLRASLDHSRTVDGALPEIWYNVRCIDNGMRNSRLVLDTRRNHVIRSERWRLLSNVVTSSFNSPSRIAGFYLCCTDLRSPDPQYTGHLTALLTIIWGESVDAVHSVIGKNVLCHDCGELLIRLKLHSDISLVADILFDVIWSLPWRTSLRRPGSNRTLNPATRHIDAYEETQAWPLQTDRHRSPWSATKGRNGEEMSADESPTLINPTARTRAIIVDTLERAINSRCKRQ